MTISRFEEICEEFARHAQVALAVPTPGRDGVLAFHVEWRGVMATVMYSPEFSADVAIVLFELGSIQGQSVEESTIMRTLLTTNFLPWRGVHAPAFACHPETGAAVLQCVHPFLAPTACTLFKLIDEGVSLALSWRENFLLHA